MRGVHMELLPWNDTSLDVCDLLWQTREQVVYVYDLWQTREQVAWTSVSFYIQLEVTVNLMVSDDHLEQ